MRKVYGQSKKETCLFCEKTALLENIQGFSVCPDHKNKQLEDKRCSCGSLLEIKRSKWGNFFLCSSCGPQSIKKILENQSGEYKLNKRYRFKNAGYDIDKTYTLDELNRMWE